MSAEPLQFRDAPGFRDLRSSEQRVMVASHWAARTGRHPAYVMPAAEVQISMIALESDTTVYHPTLTAYAHGANVALSFLMSADELEALAEGMLAMAKQVRSEASAAADAAIERAMKGGAA